MGFVEPCLPSPAKKPPAGSNWIHEIKHDAYRLMARRNPAGVRLFNLPARSCLIDGEVVALDEMGSPYSTCSGMARDAKAMPC